MEHFCTIEETKDKPKKWENEGTCLWKIKLMADLMIVFAIILNGQWNYLQMDTSKMCFGCNPIPYVVCSIVFDAHLVPAKKCCAQCAAQHKHSWYEFFGLTITIKYTRRLFKAQLFPTIEFRIYIYLSSLTNTGMISSQFLSVYMHLETRQNLSFHQNSSIISSNSRSTVKFNWNWHPQSKIDAAKLGTNLSY